MCTTILLLLILGTLAIVVGAILLAGTTQNGEQKNIKRTRSYIYHINQTGDRYRRKMNDASNAFLNKVHETTRR